jgi:DNA-binding MarR family transcriptional regulator
MAPIAMTGSGPDLETAQALRVVIGRLTRLLRPTEAGTAAELPPTRVSVLLNAERNGPIRLAEIADQEGLNPTLLSRTIGNLVEAGLVERTADPDDRRSAWVQATPTGHRMAQRIRRERTAAVEAALSALSERDRRLVEAALPALEALAAALQERRG